jgi:N-acetylmuramoyl-L-alanine amidase
MSDRPPHDPWDLSRLGDEDFVSEPLVPGRSRRLDDDEDEDLFPTPAGAGAGDTSGRRLRADERKALQRDARQKKKLPDQYFGRETPKRRWPRWGGVAVIMLVIVIAGNWSLFGGRGDGEDAPTPTIGITPTTESAEIAAEFSPTPIATNTPRVTPSPSVEPTPTAEPTPDPRFKGEVICLDPGHGGDDPGYTREADANAPALRETDINLENAKALKAKLEALGFTVVMTRDSDQAVHSPDQDVNGDGMTEENQTDSQSKESAGDIDELQARINICNAANAELLLSMHINGYPDESVSGYETWYSSARPFQWQNKLIATLIFDELGKEFAAAGYNTTARDVKDDRTADVGMARDVFAQYVITGPDQPGSINASQMPGTIVETLFISNDSDAAILASDEGRAAIVDAYVKGIVAYFDIILGPAENLGQEDLGG